CAQSLEYSMKGFPKQKPWLFKKTLGAFVMKKFLKQGFMNHSLTAAILGAPPLDSKISIHDSGERLIEGLRAFQSLSQKPAPHFAYGEVGKDDYTKLHLMHLENHLS